MLALRRPADALLNIFPSRARPATVNQAFMLKGDGMHHAASLLTPLLADGIRLLVYAGEQGASICHPCPASCR